MAEQTNQTRPNSREKGATAPHDGARPTSESVTGANRAPHVIEPELRAPQRARLVLDYIENREYHHSSQTGWARLDGPWLHWLDDEFDQWQSWPLSRVLCVEWDAAGEHA